MNIIKLNASGKRKSESGVDNSTTQINASPSGKGKSKAKDDHSMEEEDDDEEESEDEGSDEEVSLIFHIF